MKNRLRISNLSRLSFPTLHRFPWISTCRGLVPLGLLIPIGLIAKSLAGYATSIGSMGLFGHLIACCLVFSAPGIDTTHRSETIGDGAKQIGDYRRDLEAFLARSRSTDNELDQIGAVIDLCMLHSEIVGDPRFSENDRLKSFRAVAASRLRKCQKEIEAKLKRAERQAKNGPHAKSQLEHREADIPSEMSKNDRLPSPNLYLSEMAVDMHAITSITGGPITLWQRTPGNFGPLCDYGPDLVRLIETTISPDSWTRNGGTGVIYYYQPLRILVVNASTSVHSDMADFLRTMRSLSR